MSVTTTFKCDGCEAVAKGTDSLRVEFRSFSGRSYGFGFAVPVNTIKDVTPEGWIAYDPYTYCTYCPTCWEAIENDCLDKPKGDAR
jgi:hypothetical protein